MQTITFIRHAESLVNTTPDIIGGRSNNSGLSPEGVKQAHRLGERFKTEGFSPTRIYISPAKRTRETAEIALNLIGISPKNFIIDENIQEISRGEWEGKKRIEVYTDEVIKQMSESNGNFKEPEGESQREVQERMYQRLLEITDETDEDILIFSHGFAIRTLIQKILGDFQPGTIHESPSIDNTGITIIEHNGEREFFVPVFNDIKHLTL